MFIFDQNDIQPVKCKKHFAGKFKKAVGDITPKAKVKAPIPFFHNPTKEEAEAFEVFKKDFKKD
jgi:hypothetical protein